MKTILITFLIIPFQLLANSLYSTLVIDNSISPNGKTFYKYQNENVKCFIKKAFENSVTNLSVEEINDLVKTEINAAKMTNAPNFYVFTYKQIPHITPIFCLKNSK